MFRIIKKTAEMFFGLHIVARYLILSVASAMFGAGYIGLVSEFASYYYAWESGFRIPAEGIPYLAMTISTISFFLLVVFAVVFASVYLAGLYFAFYAIGMSLLFRKLGTDLIGDFSNIHSKVKELSIGTALIIGVGVGVGIWIILSLVTYFKGEYTFNVWQLSRSIFLGILFIVLIWNKRMLTLFSLLTSLFSVIAVPHMLFNTDNYSNILRELRYGGGIEIGVTLKDNHELFEYELLLRTSNALILRDSQGRVSEVPMSNVLKITYDEP
ncbi:hypothetical protein [Vibrio cholerae]|uniref:hypothetical protein n=1 Tax=Vibrio cholerae TaxID=666 RepID=UPI0030810AF6